MRAYNLIENLAPFYPQLSKKEGDALIEIITNMIISEILNNKDNLTSLSEIDLGIGKLYINISNDIEYKFIPSNYFNNRLIKSIKNNKDPLINFIGNALNNSLLEKYSNISEL